jgi:hypothetical protein
MIEIPASALLIAGFALAHATWSVSDTTPTDLLVPLAVIEHDGKRTLQRFEAETQAQAIAAGKAAEKTMSESSEAWAFARENAMRAPASSLTTQDVISVDFWARGMSAPVTLVLRFERATAGHGFHVLGTPIISVAGKELDAEEARPLIEGIMKGVFSHPKVSPLWGTWKNDA